jgi:hypothetical protein
MSEQLRFKMHLDSGRWSKIVAVIVAAGIALAAGPASAQVQPQVAVTVQVRSGVANPGWTITDAADLAQLQTLIAGLAPVAAVTPPSFGAFRLVPNSATSGLPKSILVFGGILQIVNQDNSTQFLQDSKGLAAFLVGKATLKCPEGFGFWKNQSTWPVPSLTVGGQTYTRAQLLTILNTPPGTGGRADASLILARQLIPAKLNLASGSLSVPIGSTIAGADAQLAGFPGTLPLRVEVSSTAGQAMVNTAAGLESFNQRQVTPSCSP